MKTEDCIGACAVIGIGVFFLACQLMLTYRVVPLQQRVKELQDKAIEKGVAEKVIKDDEIVFQWK